MVSVASRIRNAASQESAAPQSLYERVGLLLGLKSALHSEIDLMVRVEKGLVVGVVETLRARAGLTDEEIFQLIAPRRTLSRREALGQSLSREEADKAVRIARVTARAQQAFSGKPEYAADWLRSPKSALRERTPMQALKSESGALAVEELLVGIEHGMFG
jgi:putative toxin-antitoxin system antitoxin component (TIGR02293 family)